MQYIACFSGIVLNYKATTYCDRLPTLPAALQTSNGGVPAGGWWLNPLNTVAWIYNFSLKKKIHGTFCRKSHHRSYPVRIFIH